MSAGSRRRLAGIETTPSADRNGDRVAPDAAFNDQPTLFDPRRVGVAALAKYDDATTSTGSLTVLPMPMTTPVVTEAPGRLTEAEFDAWLCQAVEADCDAEVCAAIGPSATGSLTTAMADAIGTMTTGPLRTSMPMTVTTSPGLVSDQPSGDVLPAATVLPSTAQGTAPVEARSSVRGGASFIPDHPGRSSQKRRTSRTSRPPPFSGADARIPQLAERAAAAAADRQLAGRWIKVHVAQFALSRELLNAGLLPDRALVTNAVHAWCQRLHAGLPAGHRHLYAPATVVDHVAQVVDALKKVRQPYCALTRAVHDAHDRPAAIGAPWDREFGPLGLLLLRVGAALAAHNAATIGVPWFGLPTGPKLSRLLGHKGRGHVQRTVNRLRRAGALIDLTAAERRRYWRASGRKKPRRPQRLFKLAAGVIVHPQPTGETP